MNILMRVLARGFLSCVFAVMANIFLASPSFSAPENLDQLFLRKSRLSAASFSVALLENPGNYYIWQPESLCYTDVTTGNEVWKLTLANNNPSLFHNTIGTSPWSANGNRLLFYSTRNTQAYKKVTSNDPVWFHVRADGSSLRPVKGAGAREEWATKSSWAAWSPSMPDTNFWFGSATHGNTGVSNNVLYRTVFSDNSEVSRSPWGSIAIAGPFRDSSISSNGSKLLASNNSKSLLFPIDLTSGAALIANGYATARSFDPFWGTSDPNTFNGYHGFNLLGSGEYFWMMGNTTAVFWKFKVLGTNPDGGSVTHVAGHSYPYQWIGGESEPINTLGATATGPDPWCKAGSTIADCENYPSHIVFDRWGKNHFYLNTGPGRLSSYDSTTHRFIISDFGLSGQHQDWSGFTDWVDFSRGAASDVGCTALGYPSDSRYLNDRLYTTKYNDKTSLQAVAYTHTLYNNNGCYKGSTYEYSSLPRPSQSPDGTKIAFHSTFLNNKGTYDTNTDIFWAVAYYPYPPEVKSAAKNGDKIRLLWSYNQGMEGTPNYVTSRTYTNRGWPHESNDLPSAPREIDKFRIWVSNDNNIWTPVGTTSYNNCRGSNTCGTWAEMAWIYDIEQPSASTRYYAVTSVEYSGLESRSLSNTWKVTLDVAGNVSQQIEQTAYPAKPGAKTSFYTKAPPNIQAQYSYKEAPATAEGQYLIKWNAPSDRSMIRYYNIYANDGSLPFSGVTVLADRQKYRIASIPASADDSGLGTYRYMDWLGATDGSTKYVVTAVDYQGNESAEGLPATRLQWNRDKSGAQ